MPIITMKTWQQHYEWSFNGIVEKRKKGVIYLFMGLMFGAKLWQWQIIDKSKRQTPWAVCFYGQWNAV